MNEFFKNAPKHSLDAINIGICNRDPRFDMRIVKDAETATSLLHYLAIEDIRKVDQILPKSLKYALYNSILELINSRPKEDFHIVNLQHMEQAEKIKLLEKENEGLRVDIRNQAVFQNMYAPNADKEMLEAENKELRRTNKKLRKKLNRLTNKQTHDSEIYEVPAYINWIEHMAKFLLIKEYVVIDGSTVKRSIKEIEKDVLEKLNALDNDNSKTKSKVSYITTVFHDKDREKILKNTSAGFKVGYKFNEYDKSSNELAEQGVKLLNEIFPQKPVVIDPEFEKAIAKFSKILKGGR